MTRFQAVGLCLFTITMSILAMGLAQAGIAYTDTGWGLHPGLAFPMAVLSLIVLIPVWGCILVDDPFDVELPEDNTEIWLVHHTTPHHPV